MAYSCSTRFLGEGQATGIPGDGGGGAAEGGAVHGGVGVGSPGSVLVHPAARLPLVC